MTAASNGQTQRVLAGTALGPTISAVQAGIEGVPVNVEAVSLKGQLFAIADQVGLMPLLMFAHAAAAGLTEDSMEGMAALYAMIRDCIHEDDWKRFEAHAVATHADGEDLMRVVEQAMEIITARPTVPQSGSSAPEPSSSRKSRRASPQRGSVVPPGTEDLRPVGELAGMLALSTA